MAVNLPYVSSPGSIVNCMNKIKSAATPERVTTDFVNTILQIKEGTGAAIIPFLKKIGFVSSDGTPTELYKKFRNQTNGGKAVAESIKIGYKPLMDNNEYFYELEDKELKDLIVQVTGLDKDNSVIKQICSTFKNLKSFAIFDGQEEEKKSQATESVESIDKPIMPQNQKAKTGFNLSYTINLNLPSTTDQAVFNAIFKSLKEHLLKDE